MITSRVGRDSPEICARGADFISGEVKKLKNRMNKWFERDDARFLVAVQNTRRREQLLASLRSSRPRYLVLALLFCALGLLKLFFIPDSDLWTLFIGFVFVMMLYDADVRIKLIKTIVMLQSADKNDVEESEN